MHADKERLRLATATTAGYHGAHAAIQISGPPHCQVLLQLLMLSLLDTLTTMSN